MSRKIQIKRGAKANLPVLANGEFGYTLDTDELFIGNNGVNKPLPNKAQFDGLSSQLADITPNGSAENIVIGGNFPNTDGWVAYYGTIAAAENVLTHTVSEASGSARVGRTDVTSIAGHKYYLAYDIKPFRTHPPRFSLGGVIVVSTAYVTAGVFNRVSAEIIATAENTDFWMYVNGSVTTGMSIGSTTEFRNVLLLDLTALFGAGYEPTAAQMDDYLAKMGYAWFDTANLARKSDGKPALFAINERLTSAETGAAALDGRVSALEGTAKTVEIPYTLTQEGMFGNGDYTPSPTSVSVANRLTTEIGARYRVSVNAGFVIVLNYPNPDSPGNRMNFQFHTRMLEFVADSVSTGLTIKKFDGSNISVSEAEAIGLVIERVIYHNPTGVYDFVVAASNSSDKDKALADIVCDGTNDEVEIECAVNCNVTCSHNARVLLLPGDYNIDSFKAVRDGVTAGVGNCAVTMYRSVLGGREYSVKIEGRYKEYKYIFSSTRLLVSEACYNGLTDGVEYSIIGALRVGATNLGQMYNMFNLDVQNLFISTFGREKAIVAVDGIGTTQFSAENVHVTRYETTGWDFSIYFDTDPPATGLIGIRAGCGSNRGVGNYIKGCRIIGMYEGIALVGEHFIVQDCNVHHCWYGFSIGNYNVRTNLEHPNIFIGFSIEGCRYLGLLNRYGATEESEASYPTQTLIYIGGSTETNVRFSDGTSTVTGPIKEIVKGAYTGRVETDFVLANPIFAADGSGKNIVATNTLHRTKGTTAQRAYITGRQDGSTYFDTGLGKMLYVMNGQWRDAAGNVVS